MNETSFASLTPSLLARKGSARPAMRPQHGGMLGHPAPAANIAPPEPLDDLGWNDMGHDGADRASHNDAEVVQMSPVPSDNHSGAKLAGVQSAAAAFTSSPARDQQEVLAKRLEKKSPPVLSDAIMAKENHSAEQARGSEDMISDPAVSAASPDVSPANTAKKSLAAPAEPIQPSRVAAAKQGKRAAFTLRLDPDRHLKLRLASTIHGRSAQQIVTQALDAYLGNMPELEALAAQVKRS